MAVSKTKLLEVWNKASKVRGKDPNKYRKDACGNEIYFHSHGKKSAMGWEVDHKRSRKNGGSNSVSNLQPLHWGANRKKGGRNSNSKYC